MSNIEKYINDILVNVKPLTIENMQKHCRKSLEKYYSERKVRLLELAFDYIVINYIENKNQVAKETTEYVPF